MDIKVWGKRPIPIVEIFNSISGEGVSAGILTTFVRTAGCNLRCSYCDTTYSYDENSPDCQRMTPEEIVLELKKLYTKDILCTGGEPLEPGKDKRYLPLYFASKGFDVRIETNGSCPLYSNEEVQLFLAEQRWEHVHYTMDIKCPGSGMHQHNILEENLRCLRPGDEIKFVVSDRTDMDFAMDVIRNYKDIFATGEVCLCFSPVFNKMEPKTLVDMLKSERRFFGDHDLHARLSLQIHKMIWPPDMKGV